MLLLLPRDIISKPHINLTQSLSFSTSMHLPMPRSPRSSHDGRRPQLLLVEFFNSIGLSDTALTMAISWHPTLLALSLGNKIIPSYKWIKSIFNGDDDEKVVKALKRFPKIMQLDVVKTIASNISVLKGHGVPDSYIFMMLTRYGSSLGVRCDKFEKCVKEVIELGSKPTALAFVLAVQVTAEMSESTWNRKVEAYRQWGWSEAEFRAAFRSNPVLMKLSEKKITSGMEFLVNNMDFESAVLAKTPTILHYSLERRIIPRCSVIKLLLLKGLINKDLALGTYCAPTEKVFLDKFVTKYEKDAPELLSVYQGKMIIL